MQSALFCLQKRQERSCELRILLHSTQTGVGRGFDLFNLLYPFVEWKFGLGLDRISIDV